MLLHLGMDGPNVNLAFEQKLKVHMQESSRVDFLQIGTCSLHPVHTGFKNGLKELDFPFDSFFHDLSFFFHLSSARREDFRSIENVTDIIAHFMKKHGPTRWLFMKLVGVRVLEQLANLKEHFLKFLPRQKGMILDMTELLGI